MLKKRAIDAVEASLLVEAERQELVHRLRVGVQPAALGDGAVDTPVVLLQRPLLAVVSVDLRARRDQHALVELVAVLEHRRRALQVRDHRVHGLLDDQAHADGGRQVVDDVALVDELADDRRGEHRVDDEVKAGPVAQRLDVAMRACGKVVEDEDLRASIEQGFREVGADEARPARDQGLLGHRGRVPAAYPKPAIRPFNTREPVISGPGFFSFDPFRP